MNRLLKTVCAIPLCLTLTGALLFQGCSEEETIIAPADDVRTSAQSTITCGCTYTVPSGTKVIDGLALKLAPGSTICLNASYKYTTLLFRNIRGTATQPIIIKNCGGTVQLNGTGMGYTIKTEYSSHFKIQGGTGNVYGIRVTGGHMGITLEKLSTDFELNNLEVYGVGFAGIMAKTDPTCDNATIRGNFVMRNTSFHDNYIHDTAGEGIYIGNSFYEQGMTTPCGVRYPHLIDGLKIYKNKIVNAGWEAIQVGCALSGAYVYANTIQNYGAKNSKYQNNGIQFSAGTKAICYENSLNGGYGIGIMVIGHGDAFIHDNLIVKAGAQAIFCDERNARNLPGMRIINNTIVSPKSDGIRLYTEYVPNKVYNNIIVNPGSYSTYTYPRTGNDAYVYKLTKTMGADIQNNLNTRDINSVKFADVLQSNYRVTSASPAINKGKDVRVFSIPNDYYLQPRLKGTAFDIGASEY